MKKGSIIAEIQTERHKYHMVREQGQKKLAVPVALTSACLPRDYISTIQLGGDLKKERKKLLRKTSMAEKRSAVSTLFQLPSAFQEPSGPCLLFLIGLLARIADYIIQHSALPILILKGVQEVPPPLLTLLGLLNGPDEIPTGSRTAIKRPSYISAIVPLGSSAPSYDLVDYIGGRIHFDLAGKWRCWLPLTCHTMAVAPSVPRRVSDSIITQSPLAIPVVCHLLGKKPDRPIIELEGSHFLSYDPELLSQFQEATPLIHALLTEFFVWLLDKQKRMDKLWEASDNFRPSLRNGRFVSRDNSYQATLYSHGLAIFKLLLQYASDKKGWITNEAANDYLLRMWQVILPESAPTSKKADFPWDDRNTFWI